MSTSNAGGGSVTAPDGSDLAKDATADRAADAAERLAETVQDGPPLGNTNVVVYVRDGEVATRPAESTLLSAQPAPEDPIQAQPVYVAGTASVSDVTAQQALANIRSQTDELEEDAERIADATESTSAKLGTLAAQESTVDELEPDIEEIRTDADATRIALQSIDAKTLAPLGTALLAPLRGTATTSAAQLPSLSTPRGFFVDNIDAANPLYYGFDGTVTTANGIRIEPGYGEEFDLPNTNLVWLVSPSTTAWQRGGTS